MSEVDFAMILHAGLSGAVETVRKDGTHASKLNGSYKNDLAG